MSPVAIALDILLAGLLLAALVVGARLNARLRTLREGQVGFAQAVADLNVAAGRAEAGLASLRTASEETHDSLLARIETARGLITRLERAALEAERAAPGRPIGGPEPLQVGLAERAALNGRAGPHPTAPASFTLSSAASNLAPSAGLTPSWAPPPSPNRRPLSDDDLFEPGGDAAPRSAWLERDPGRQKGDRR